MTALQLRDRLRDLCHEHGAATRWRDLTPEQVHFRARVAKAHGARLYSWRNDRGLWDSTEIARLRRAD